MRTAVKLVTLMGNQLVPMSARIPATQAANLIAYWKLGETSGTTAADSSATGADGVYTGTYTLGQTGIGDGSLSTLFAGGRVSLAANLGLLNTAFLPSKGTLLAALKVTNAGIWTDGVARQAVCIGADASNRIDIIKRLQALDNSISVRYRAGATSKQFDFTLSTLNWFQLCITWDSTVPSYQAYLNGSPATALAGATTWSGSLASTFTAIADRDSAGSAGSWAGYMAQVALWKVALTPSEVAYLAPASFFP